MRSTQMWSHFPGTISKEPDSKSSVVQPTEFQYLVINALQTLDLLDYEFYDEDSGDWYIATSSTILPISVILLVPTNWKM